jgi:hypothetical protein
VAPGVDILSTTLNGNYNTHSGTSCAAPHVSGIAALILSINPNLTWEQVRSIIGSTCTKVNQYSSSNPSGYTYSYTSSHPYDTWNQDVGYGLVNAYVAANIARSTFAWKTDLYIKDNPLDFGIEPNITTAEHWISPNIQIIDANTLQPVVNPNVNVNYKVRVRVHNKGDRPSTGYEKLYLYWAKAGMNVNWPSAWHESIHSCNGVSLKSSGKINATPVYVPANIPVGGYMDIDVDWLASNRPDINSFVDCVNYLNQGRDPNGIMETIWHYCILAIIEDGYEIPNYNATTDVLFNSFVLNSNNVASANISFMEGQYNNNFISIINSHLTANSNISLQIHNSNNGLLKYAEVYFQPSDNLQSAIDKSGKLQGFKHTKEGLLLTSNEATIDNLQLTPDELHLLKTSVYFLSKEIPESETFTFDVKMLADGMVVGGERYIAARDLSRYFAIQAHAEAILKDKTLILTADKLNEPAKYIWYNSEEKEIGSGNEIEIELPKTSGWYKLEVIAEKDNYKDYDDVYVNIPAGFIVSLAPNPAQDKVRVEYFLSDIANSAQIYIYNSFGNLVKQETLKISEKEIYISLQEILSGNYSVVLVVNDSPTDSKQLLKQ